MLDALHALVAPAAMERFTLLLNHVLNGEAAATARLKPHAGRCIGLHLSHWPALLPAPPAMVFRVTPAGLLEWAGAEPPPTDLHVTLNASNPALLAMRWLSGEPPAMEIVGDAALASDVHWLADHLRWDVADDLERLFGPAVARELSRLGALVAGALRRAAQAGAGFASARAAGEARSPWSSPRPQ
jgi:ubiquinone biosynthesis protein UbiJ